MRTPEIWEIEKHEVLPQKVHKSPLGIESDFFLST